MSPLRNTARPLGAAVAATLVLLSIAACGGRDETDLSNGKAQFVQKCGSCHILSRAGTAGQTGPSEILISGPAMDRERTTLFSLLIHVRVECPRTPS